MSLLSGELCWSSMSELIRDRVTRVTRCTCFRIALLKPWLTPRLPVSTRSCGACPNSNAKVEALRLALIGYSAQVSGPDSWNHLSKRKVRSFSRNSRVPGIKLLHYLFTELGSKVPTTYSIPARLSNCFRTCIHGPERTRGCRKATIAISVCQLF